MGKTCILINNKKLIINRQSRKLYYDILVVSSFRLSFYPAFPPTSCLTRSPRHSKAGGPHLPWKMTANRMNERVLIDSFSFFRIFHLIFKINQKQFPFWSDMNTNFKAKANTVDSQVVQSLCYPVLYFDFPPVRCSGGITLAGCT